jgi:hypothetical protein
MNVDHWQYGQDLIIENMAKRNDNSESLGLILGKFDRIGNLMRDWYSQLVRSSFDGIRRDVTTPAAALVLTRDNQSDRETCSNQRAQWTDSDIGSSKENYLPRARDR